MFKDECNCNDCCEIKSTLKIEKIKDLYNKINETLYKRDQLEYIHSVLTDDEKLSIYQRVLDAVKEDNPV